MQVPISLLRIRDADGREIGFSDYRSWNGIRILGVVVAILCEEGVVRVIRNLTRDAVRRRDPVQSAGGPIGYAWSLLAVTRDANNNMEARRWCIPAL